MVRNFENFVLLLTSTADTCHALAAADGKFSYRAFKIHGVLNEIDRISLAGVINYVTAARPQVWGYLPTRFEVPAIISQAVLNGLGVGGFAPGEKYNDRDYSKPFGDACWSFAPFYGSVEQMPKNLTELEEHRARHIQKHLDSHWFMDNPPPPLLDAASVACLDDQEIPEWVVSEYNVMLRASAIAQLK